MMQGLYISSTGMQTHNQGLGVIGNNLANASTIGFKQQLMLFQTLGSADLTQGTGFEMETKQMGMGAGSAHSRTLFSQGAITAADNMTDLAIGGKGFFQVSDGVNDFYTRAGNFHFDHEGIMRTPGGAALSGIPINHGVESGQVEEIDIGANNDAFKTSPSKATSEITALMNLYTNKDTFSDPENPYFSMIQSWDGTQKPPLSGAQSLSLSYYDAEGTRQDLQVYIDQASSIDGEKVYEYTVAMDPTLDGRDGYAGTKSAGLLMSGTMSFSPAGELVNMSSFSPTGGDLTDPSGWTLSALEGGVPSVNIKLAGQENQTLKLDFGISTTANSWETKDGNAVAGITADTVGANFVSLPGMVKPTHGSGATTSLDATTALKNIQQDGYPVGDLVNLHIDDSGILRASYTNGQTNDLYRIPVFRFTSEDGLRREGDNLYSQTDDAGKMEYGTAGTENYGKIYSQNLEQSNVDMSREMVNMIVIQRGFQSNSKSMQTIDSMIQKAIEMKR